MVAQSTMFSYPTTYATSPGGSLPKYYSMANFLLNMMLYTKKVEHVISFDFSNFYDMANFKQFMKETPSPSDE